VSDLVAFQDFRRSDFNRTIAESENLLGTVDVHIGDVISTTHLPVGST
jgi:hypothetical protein